MDYIFSLRLDLMCGQPKGGAERAGVDIQDYTLPGFQEVYWELFP
ncbi:MAG: hypothetical protein R2784_20860 [Saprospiraceae bacterium]